MESLHPTHSISPTTEQQKLINRETSVVELPPASPVGQHDADRGASASSDAFTPAAAQVPAAPALSTISTSPVTLLSPLQHSSPTQAEIDAHPIRRRLSLHGEHIAATRWAQNRAEPERQEQLEGLSAKAGAQSTEGSMAEVKEGDKVAWNWGSGAPGGVASEVVTDGEAKMVSHRGNEVKKQGSPENPAVHIERSGNDVVKKASELEVEEKGPNHDDKKSDDAKDDKKENDEKKEETNGDAKTGEKRSASEANKDDDDDDDKKDDSAAAKENGDAAQPPKKKGRPAKSGGGAKKETKKKQPKPAATADGKPRRSGRNKS